VAKKKRNPDVLQGGWYRPTVNVVSAFKKKLGRDPDEGELGRLRYIVKYGMQAHRAPINETTLETAWLMLGHFLKDPSKGLPPQKYVMNVLGPRAQAVVQQHINAYHAQHSSFFSKLNPVKLISAAADVVSKVAPFVELAVSFVPVAGQIYSVAKTAVNIGTSLAKGRPLTDAFIDGAVGMMPGGAVAQRAARAVVSLAKGRSLTGAMLDQVKEQFPGADRAIAAAAGIVEGRRLQDIAIEEVKGMAGKELRALKMPIPAGVDIPPGMRHGAEVAVGVLKRSQLPNGAPLTPAAALAIRKRLAPAQRLGFDRILAMRARKNFEQGSRNVPRPVPKVPRGTQWVTSQGVQAL
jgi:hypothetical protein